VRRVAHHGPELRPGRLAGVRLPRLTLASFLGLRLHLVTTVHGLPVVFALTNPKVDECDVLVDLVSLYPGMFQHPDGLILVVDRGYRDRVTETWLNEAEITLVRPAYRDEPLRPGRMLLPAVPQTIESVNDTLKDQLGLERHGGRTTTGEPPLQRILTLTASIWHNWHTGQPITRLLIAYDH
jgi:Transposase DDE domain